MTKTSAGFVMYRFHDGTLQVFLVHPGGPFWAKKDLGAWSIPKGECESGEDPLTVARREFEEETGFVPRGESYTALTPLKQPSGKMIYAWALKGDRDPLDIRSNTFSIVWPPQSGRQQEFPEIDRAGWFDIEEAKKKVLKGQGGFLEELHQKWLSRGIERGNEG